ncbi:sugar phosphate nucleotidyltransferase [Cytobacillus sp. FJAT-54145]|uniref:Glucose-1-phosphate thymidylyltransferase n=1 Tax=Cytobacillus spartinae TaxID=3299023 RepID=A0ABW6KEJ6_9BACI
MKALLLCAGKGTRMYPLTESIPKACVPLNGVPMIVYSLEQLTRAGIREVGLVVSPFSHPFLEDLLGDGREYGVSLTYLMQEEPLGIAHAVGVAKDFLQHAPFFVALGDNLTNAPLLPMIQSFSSQDALVATRWVDDPSRYGILQTNGMAITQIVEKPNEDIGREAAAGFYLFSPAFFEVLPFLLPSSRGEYEISDVIQLLVDRGKHCEVFRLDGWWKDVGTPLDVEETEVLLTP